MLGMLHKFFSKRKEGKISLGKMRGKERKKANGCERSILFPFASITCVKDTTDVA